MTSLFPEPLLTQAQALLTRCRERQLRIATAESCTGGLIAGLLTEIPGSSDVVERGFVTYTNQAKTELLGVRAELFDTVGAVSEDVARAMAEGAIHHSHAALAVAVTGIAGPGGGSAEKPVGLVHFACHSPGGMVHRHHLFSGDRSAIRLAAVQTALQLLWDGAAP